MTRIIGNEIVTEDSAATIEKTSVSTTPHHGDEEVGGALAGGVGGAAVGAVVGIPVGAVVGGAIGATSGATIGAVDTRKKDEVDEAVVTNEERRPQLGNEPHDRDPPRRRARGVVTKSGDGGELSKWWHWDRRRDRDRCSVPGLNEDHGTMHGRHLRLATAPAMPVRPYPPLRDGSAG